ncbi:MAG: hypothetical protein AVDCRST_MAG38-770 [uncultured Solirubrobacteraceae bacterium]|uniref:Polysaccharide lyase-like protein n=1 Tax=uncultured Solirubrobacteraceae bacterium TaxID=1162706 RepID=A0A6J4R7T3_9ACTN|nr:MAG: hypothetical protein AVDCRST_MAG38-770 [uncultured Solirubrobacteraceae bacterium]
MRLIGRSGSEYAIMSTVSATHQRRRSRRLIFAAAAALLVLAIALVVSDRFGGDEASRPAQEPTSSPQKPAKLVFSSDFSDGIDEFSEQIHPERISAVDDPVLGSDRKVLKFEVYNEDTGPTENPRAQLETPRDFEEGDDRFAGFSYYFPEEFPTELPSQAWVSLGSIAYGPPYDGAGPLSIRVQNAVDGSGAEIRWQRNDTYDNDIPWIGPKIEDIQGRWVDFVFRAKLGRDSDDGFVELWMNTGSGWERQKLDGDEEHLEMNTYDDSNDGGPNNSRLGLYYRADIPGPLTLYQGPIKIATAGEGAFELVAPDSYR